MLYAAWVGPMWSRTHERREQLAKKSGQRHFGLLAILLGCAGMELKPGYKQTEVGVIPEDWATKSIKQISDPVRGGSPRPAGDPRFFNGTYIPWLTVAALTNIPESQLVVTETAACLTEEGSLRSRTLLPGTLIIANSGATLGVAKLLGVKCCANDGIAALHNVDKNVSAEYLAHFINTKTTYLREVVATGNGQPNLNTGLIGDFNIPVPPTKGEQEAIAEALSDADALIESLEQLLTKKRHLKQAAMQELLTGKMRLPGFSGAWEVKRLGDVGECLRGVAYRGDSDLSAFDTKYTRRLLRSNNVQDAAVITADIQFVNSDRVSEKQLLRERDILVCMANGSKALVGKAGFFNVIDGYEYTFGAFMGCFRTITTDANATFVFYLFQTGRYRNYINNLLAGSSINNLTPTSIESLDFSFPPLPEQTAIAAVLSDMDTEITELETQLDKSHALKQGMMQKLLTGEIRLGGAL
ncbi:MAG: restriction endonuclease subunit S [Betaproteobacteria bacterium]|nr:restriction endonuclease subunit S [Betaproteobacteria bacterium]